MLRNVKRGTINKEQYIRKKRNAEDDVKKRGRNMKRKKKKY